MLLVKILNMDRTHNKQGITTSLWCLPLTVLIEPGGATSGTDACWISPWTSLWFAIGDMCATQVLISVSGNQQRIVFQSFIYIKNHLSIWKNPFLPISKPYSHLRGNLENYTQRRQEFPSYLNDNLVSFFPPWARRLEYVCCGWHHNLQRSAMYMAQWRDPSSTATNYGALVPLDAWRTICFLLLLTVLWGASLVKPEFLIFLRHVTYTNFYVKVHNVQISAQLKRKKIKTLCGPNKTGL